MEDPAKPPKPAKPPPEPFEIDLELSDPDDPPLVVKPGTLDLRTPEGRAEHLRRQGGRLP